jgi:hypothetical protein
MFPGVSRYRILGLFVVLLLDAFLPGDAGARGAFYPGPGGYGFGPPRTVYGAVTVGIGRGYGYYGYPLDDSYDRPSGYGEYAEYGPWAHRGYGECAFTQRRVRTVHGLRWRTVNLCN